MYGENRLEDVIRFSKALLTNQVAHFAPQYYVRLTGETGRGRGKETSKEVADYFVNCFDDYFKILDITDKNIGAYLKNKVILEYGPGDIPGVALLMYAYGAGRVYCVDRFPLVSFSAKNIEVLHELIGGLNGEAKNRARECFQEFGDPSSGLKFSAIKYLVTPNGLSGMEDAIDLIISRAVLEHVNDLRATLSDMHKALRVGGLSVHKVDLKSHGLHKRSSLDFLTWPKVLWKLMYSHKGAPNRLRINDYVGAIQQFHFQIHLLEPTLCADPDEIEEVKPMLAKMFQGITDEELSWLSFWMVLERN